MVRRMIAMAAGVLVLVALAMLPTTAGAQVDDDDYPPEITTPSVAPTSVVPPTSRPPGPPSSIPPGPPTSEVLSDEETPPPSAAPAPPSPPAPEVQGDVVSRPLPRTGNDIGGTALFGGALTVLGVALALGARKRRNSFEGA
jgi:LPXTG-motif cell wall-anchored protein